MAHEILQWLASYKDQIGIVLNSLLLLATSILIFVGIEQAKAARKQAQAAAVQLD